MTQDDSIKRILDTLSAYIQRNNYLSDVGSRYKIYHNECENIRREIENITKYTLDFMDLKINLEWIKSEKPRGIDKVYLIGLTEIKRKEG